MRLTILGMASLLAVGLAGEVCHAQTRGFALDRYEPAERGSDWFAADSLDLRGDGRLAVGATLDYAHKPLVPYDENDEPRPALISRQTYLHLGASYVMMDWLRLGINLPLLVSTAGTDVTSGGSQFAAPSGAALGDIRLGADARLLGEHGEAFTLAAGLWVYVPNGSTDAFVGDGSTRVQPRVAAAGRIGAFEYAAKTGINLRTVDQNFAGEPFGTEWQFTTAAGVRLLDEKLLLGPELWGSTVLGEGGSFDREATPLEVALGGHYRHEDWSFGLGAGPGITRGLGTPKARVLASIEYSPQPKMAPPPPPTPMDSDDDGIVDEQDACPDVPGVIDEDPAKNGCPPPPPDDDGDGIINDDDACPDVAGVANEDPKKNGCPADSDGDGIIDAEDACPQEAGVPSAVPEKNGCPLPPDTDEDGIVDAEDACPEKAGPRRDDPKKNGCPRARVTKTKVEILDRIEFDTGKATIRPESDDVLQAVFELLNGHPDIELVSVEGHTDNRGSRWLNRKLSSDRAKSVVAWLVEHGIDKQRLTSAGFGPDKPIDSNDTDVGRQNNRRVEFQIVRRSQPKQDESTEGDEQ